MTMISLKLLGDAYMLFLLNSATKYIAGLILIIYIFMSGLLITHMFVGRIVVV